MSTPDIQAMTTELLTETEKFLANPKLDLDYIHAWREALRRRLNLREFTVDEGNLCCTCQGNFVNHPWGGHWLMCKECTTATVAISDVTGEAPPFLLVSRGRPVGATLESDSAAARRAAVKAAAHDLTEWRRYTCGLLARRHRIHDRWDIAMEEWLDLVGRDPQSWSARYSFTLESKVPELVRHHPYIADQAWLEELIREPEMEDP